MRWLSVWVLLGAWLASEAGRLSARLGGGGPGREDVSQTAVDCPTGCSCVANTIICRGGNLTNTDNFLSISDTFYPDLDTLVVEGNRFGELGASNLFGASVRHERLTSLSLADNGLRIIHARAFHALEHLESLDLSRNDIRQVSGDVLLQMPRLRKLSLAHSLAADATGDRAETRLLHKLFAETKTDLAKLEELDLSDNRLYTVPPDLLCRLPALRKLNLRGNFLRELPFANASCTRSLKQLDLSNNQISVLLERFIKAMDAATHLDQLNLSSNPFNCDCFLRPLVQWLKSTVSGGSSILVRAKETKCADAAPASLLLSGLLDVDESVLQCRGGSSAGSVFLALFLVTGALCVAFLVWRRSRRLCPGKLDPANFPKLPTPSFKRLSQGYTQLASSHNPPPEFI